MLIRLPIEDGVPPNAADYEEQHPEPALAVSPANGCRERRHGADGWSDENHVRNAQKTMNRATPEERRHLMANHMKMIKRCTAKIQGVMMDAMEMLPSK